MTQPIFEDELPSEVFPEPVMGVGVCENPFCPDVGVERPQPMGVDSYWCGTCGVRMLPPEAMIE